MTSQDALRFAVIGSPIAHSKSPAMHTAAYRALGLPHVYEKLETSLAELPARVASVRDGTLAGINVTVPHKTHVLSLVDDLDPTARAIGAANTLVRSAERIRAYNTDAPALEAELVALANRDVFAGSTAIVLGTGGAARSAVFALGKLGVSHVIVRGRTERKELAEVLQASAIAPARLTFEPLDAPPSESSELRAIVQATTAGMSGGAPSAVVTHAIAWPTVPPSAVILDVVYTSGAETPLLAHAKSRGLRCDDGLGMLVRQGALAFELWLGVLLRST